MSAASCARPWPAATSVHIAIVKQRSGSAIEGTVPGRYSIKCAKKASTELSPALAVDGAYCKRSEGELAAELQNARRQGTRNLAKRGGANVIHGRVVPIRPVEGVEGICL